jgi:predicted AAA+ superfamily ATPase
MNTKEKQTPLTERTTYMQILRDLREEHLIKVVTGMRRSGKSTLLEMFANELRQSVGNDRVQVYNFETLEIMSIGDYFAIYKFISNKLVPNEMNFIFLDEVQNIVGFERMVDSLYIKDNVDLYVTGSNAYLLSSELATLLTGRYIEVNLLPFSFSEYAIHVQNMQNLVKDELFTDFIYSGGLPQAVNMRFSVPKQENNFIKAVLDTIIEKDIFTRREVYNKQAFNKTIDFLMDSIGSYISPNSIVNTLRSNKTIINNETVTNYLSYLSETYLFYRVPRYDVKGKNLLKTLDKYYLADTGFRKVRLGKKNSADRGHLLENMVYLELRRRNREVYVGKLRDKEIDFVAVDDEGYVSYYQVAYSVVDAHTLERELEPLRLIKDSNPKYLLSTDWDNNPVFDGIRKYNVINWMLNL